MNEENVRFRNPEAIRQEKLRKKLEDMAYAGRHMALAGLSKTPTPEKRTAPVQTRKATPAPIRKTAPAQKRKVIMWCRPDLSDVSPALRKCVARDIAKYGRDNIEFKH